MRRSIPQDFIAAKNVENDGVLLGYQRRWLEDRSPVKVAEKGRRVGLSWAEAGDDALYASRENGDDVWYIGYNKDMAQEFINDCAEWAKYYNLAASEMEEEIFEDEDKEILSFVIRFKNSGHRITALSSRPTNLRGKQGRVVIDEAAFHDDLPGLIKAAMALLMWGGDVRIISTHNGDSNEFNSLVQDILSGAKPYSHHKITFDDAIGDGLCRRIFQVLGREWSPETEAAWRQEMVDFYGDDADEELFCIPSQGSGLFLTRALIEKCMNRELKVIRYSQPQDFEVKPDRYREMVVSDWLDEVLLPELKKLDSKRRSYFGWDFGRDGDLSVFLPLIERQNVTYYAPFILELRKIPFTQQEQILKYIVDRLPRFTHGALDARGNGQYQAERAMQAYGESRISRIMLSEAWYRENMTPFKKSFEDKTILLPYDADVVDDLRAFKMIRGVAKLPEKRTKGQADKQQRHGDAGVAAALADFATRQESGEMPDVVSAGRRQTINEYSSYVDGVRLEHF